MGGALRDLCAGGFFFFIQDPFRKEAASVANPTPISWSRCLMMIAEDAVDEDQAEAEVVGRKLDCAKGRGVASMVYAEDMMTMMSSRYYTFRSHA